MSKAWALRADSVQGSGPYTFQVLHIPQMHSEQLQGLGTMFLIKDGQNQVLILLRTPSAMLSLA